MDWIHTGLPVLGAIALTWVIVRSAFDRVRREQDAERVLVTDIARREAVQSERRLRMVLESLPSALLMFDARGQVVFANPQADRVFGYRAGGIVGTDVATLVSTGEGADVAHWMKSVDPGQPIPEDHRVEGTRADGTRVQMLMRVRIADTPEGRFGLAFVADISERLQFEREREQQREELTHLARVGTLAELSGS